MSEFKSPVYFLTALTIVCAAIAAVWLNTPAVPPQSEMDRLRRQCELLEGRVTELERVRIEIFVTESKPIWVMYGGEEE